MIDINPPSKESIGRGILKRYYKESVIRLEFITYTDREVHVFRSTIAIINFSQTKFSSQINKEFINFISDTYTKASIKFLCTFHQDISIFIFSIFKEINFPNFTSVSKRTISHLTSVLYQQIYFIYFK